MDVATSGDEFLIIRLVWIVLYYLLAGAAMFVVIWWPGVTILRLARGERWQKTDEIVVAMAVVGLATAIRQLLWLPSHYHQGRGDVMAATWWANDAYEMLWLVLLLHIFGYGLHIHYAWTPLSRVILVTGFVLWAMLGLVIFTHLGGWDYTYVWHFSWPRYPIECYAAP